MAEISHERLVETQFGATANAYVESKVHAQGADLKALAQLAQEYPQGRVLDLGCGGGHVSFHAAAYVREVVACDLSSDMLGVVAKIAQSRQITNLTTQKGYAERLPFDERAFDLVLSRYSAHHWRDLGAGLREAARVLKAGGRAGFVDVISPGPALLDSFLQAVELLRDPSHVRDYSRAEWEMALAASGLVCEKTQRFRVKLNFADWVQRMKTPLLQAEAIRALQRAISGEVRDYFEICSDGSFSIDVGLFVTRRQVAVGVPSV
jgi:ubiquinone/menaquinone biosynthesis C-methylase UbiE